MTITDCEKQMEKTTQLCKEKKVLEAINVLKELNKKFLEDEAKKQPLLDEATDCPVFLQVTMKKIPYKKMSKRIKVPLPHSMVTDTTEVCLFTGDLDKRNKKAEIDPDVLHYKELLKKQGITKITEVIPLRQLRTEYKVYEARRQLMAAYDVFLSDKKIAQCLPKLLGKTFFKKRKFPIQINMNTSNLKSQIEKALSETVFSVSCRGTSCASEVAHLGMDDNEILENVLASVKILADKLPGEQDNIFGIYIKTAKSQAIPIFISFGNPNEVKLQKPHIHEKVELEELSTLPNAEVSVFRDGRIYVKKTLADSGDEAASPEVVNEIKSRHGKRKRRMDAEAADEDVNEDSLEVKSESESVDAEEDISPSKTKLKKKRKTSVKKESQGDTESEESEVSSEATEMHLKDEVEDIEEDTSANKTKLRNKRGKANVKNKVQDETENTRKRKSVNAVEDEDVNTSTAQLKLKKKKTADIKIEESVRVLRKAQPKVRNNRIGPAHKMNLRQRS